jgi:hypothetical protein
VVFKPNGIEHLYPQRRLHVHPYHTEQSDNPKAGHPARQQRRDQLSCWSVLQSIHPSKPTRIIINIQGKHFNLIKQTRKPVYGESREERARERGRPTQLEEVRMDVRREVERQEEGR